MIKKGKEISFTSSFSPLSSLILISPGQPDSIPMALSLPPLPQCLLVSPFPTPMPHKMTSLLRSLYDISSTGYRLGSIPLRIRVRGGKGRKGDPREREAADDPQV
jgi:hypothetical protein